MIIRIEKTIKSQNHFVGKHWSVKNKDSKEWEELIWAELNGKIPWAKKKMAVKIRSVRKKLIDISNLWGGIKGLLDAIVRLGLIIDDSPQYLDLEVMQVKACGQEPGKTVVEIMEAG